MLVIYVYFTLFVNDTHRSKRIVVVALFARKNDFEKQSNVKPRVHNPLSRLKKKKKKSNIIYKYYSFREEYLKWFCAREEKRQRAIKENETNVTRWSLQCSLTGTIDCTRFSYLTCKSAVTYTHPSLRFSAISSIPFPWPEISLHFLRDGYVSLRLFIEVTTTRRVCRVLSPR